MERPFYRTPFLYNKTKVPKYEAHFQVLFTRAEGVGKSERGDLLEHFVFENTCLVTAGPGKWLKVPGC